MGERPQSKLRSLLLGIALCGAAVAYGLGCNALLEIGDIEFSDSPSTGTATDTGGGGQGGDGAGTSSGGWGGSPGGEYCVNGLDDDDDGDIDCADDDCSSYRCVPLAPAGWLGPAALYVGDGATQLPPCAGAWTAELDLGSGVTGAPASCSSCGCNTPTGGSCTVPQVTHYDSATDCTVPFGPFTPDPNGCQEFWTDDPNDSFLAGNDTLVSPGSCTTTGGNPTTQPVTWSELGRLCIDAVASAGGCLGGDVCVPVPGASYLPGVCIHQDGDANCPAEYPNKTLFFSNHTDNRGCSSCSCGTASGQSCNGALHMYDGPTCAGGATAVPADGTTCVQFSSSGTQNSYRWIESTTGGSCPASGGNPTGTVTDTEPITICCDETR